MVAVILPGLVNFLREVYLATHTTYIDYQAFQVWPLHRTVNFCGAVDNKKRPGGCRRLFGPAVADGTLFRDTDSRRRRWPAGTHGSRHSKSQQRIRAMGHDRSVPPCFASQLHLRCLHTASMGQHAAAQYTKNTFHVGILTSGSKSFARRWTRRWSKDCAHGAAWR